MTSHFQFGEVDAHGTAIRGRAVYPQPRQRAIVGDQTRMSKLFSLSLATSLAAQQSLFQLGLIASSDHDSKWHEPASATHTSETLIVRVWPNSKL